jgi:class 3 adenylate cyclase
MSLLDDLISQSRNIFHSQWEKRDGTFIPETDDIALGNSAVTLDATILYADLAESTYMVNSYEPSFSAEIYKAYLNLACRIISDNDGEITAFDGDRVMAVFIGDRKNTSAAETALKINWCVSNIINDEIKRQYTRSDFQIKQAVGIDTGPIWVARTGIRGSNDLVWVGRAANYAAKLCSLRSGNKVTWITEEVFNKLADTSKYSNGTLMWEKQHWSEFNCIIYSSSYWWKIA